ncbi:MAG: hypothetical protein LC104_02845 [Bacteroidales bacterium]|nr:hypothetical protein [Bacteroidales bacterium]
MTMPNRGIQQRDFAIRITANERKWNIQLTFSQGQPIGSLNPQIHRVTRSAGTHKLFRGIHRTTPNDYQEGAVQLPETEHENFLTQTQATANTLILQAKTFSTACLAKSSENPQTMLL